MIRAGLVTVNGDVVSELGSKADWTHDRIVVAGKPLRPAAHQHHLLFYKPKGVVTTLSDPEGRPTIQPFLRGIRERLYPAGRLDFHSEGLLLLTNDGELANRVLHASSALPKTYWVKVAGRPDEAQLDRLRKGIMISRAAPSRGPRASGGASKSGTRGNTAPGRASIKEGRRTAPARIRWLAGGVASGRERKRAGVYRTSNENPWLEVVLIEGRYHQIRKMFAAIGHPVEKLKRVGIGTLTIGTLKPGAMRPLTEAEIHRLRRVTAPRVEKRA